MEVLVVLVVLVVGVLAIARLFPAGFLSLRGAENNSYAGRLAQGALDVLKQNNTALADGIYMYRSDTQAFDPGYTPDNLKALTPGTATAYDDINKARYISNETVTVPAARSGFPFGLYALNFGPFDPTVALMVNGTLWTAKSGDSRLNASDPSGTATLDNPVDILQPGQQTFLFDLGEKNIAVPPAAYVDSTGADLGQEFVATVQTLSSTGVQNTTDVAFTVPTAKGAVLTSPAAGAWFNLPTFAGLGSTSPVVTDTWTSVTLYRPFAQVATTGDYGTDPYQYALYNPSGGPNGMQTLAFNSLAGGRVGVSPLQARLSYSTQDWHILHEDRDVPAIGTGDTTTIRLALSGLKKVGDIQFDQTLFGGLIPDPNNQYDVMLLDRDTGKFYGLTGSGAGQNVTNTDDNSGTGTTGVSYLNGRITFPDTFSTDDPLPPLPSPRMKHLRIFYAGTADWAVAVQKAPKFYQVQPVAIPKFPPSQMVLSYVTASNSNTPNRCLLLLEQNAPYSKQLAFPLCDSGKMVQVTVGAQPPLTIVIPVTTGPGKTVQYVDVSNLFPGATAVDPASVKITITGLSARALVIWHERDQWKTRSIDTLLTHLD